MTASQIKYIAIITMVIDHVGLFFFPDLTILRDIGRISFPLFCWLIANGAYHTKDTYKYLKRLFLFALISQIPFTLANQLIGSPLFFLNVLFTLSLGLLAIIGIKNNKNIFLQTAIVVFCGLTANVIHSDYGASGVFSIVLFYLFFNNKMWTLISQALVFVGLPIALDTVLKIPHHFSSPLFYISVEWYALLALPVIFLYNNKKGNDFKYLFYIFYPVQYVLIFLGLILLG